MGDAYKLSASLRGHEDDVRDVAFASSSSIISASRDATVRVWDLQSSAPPSYDDSIVTHGQSFINAVTYLPASSQFSEPLIASGGKDTIIELRHPGRPPDASAQRILLGHQGNVCALDVCPDPKTPYLVSGSWDASAIIWDVAKGESIATLEGHSGSVWAVLALDSKHVVTGCADHKIRLFSVDGKLLKIFEGSSDVVRALCRLPGNHSSGARFASAGNDAVIRLWTLDGRQITQLHGHDNFIYSLTSLPSGELVSSGEDRTVRIWRDNKNTQTITHPAISVWAVAANPKNGDIVSGASDRIVRVFSCAAERQGNEETIKAFEDSVKESSIPKQAMGDQVNKEQLPGPEFLQKKSGVKEGQVQMIREANGSISAHQWSHLAQQWVSVGTVVDAAGSSGRKQEYLGHDYDYVFDVDIEEGKPPLKLPYNLSQNPYEVARKFIEDNELPLSYLDQVADFIVRNTKGASIGQASSSTTSSAPPPSTRPKVLPQKEYLSITTANFSLIARKVQELNSQLLKDGRKDLALSPDEIVFFPRFVGVLEASLSKSPSEDDVGLLDSGSDLIMKIVTAWPPQNRIPGMDLLRCLAAANPSLSQRHNLLDVLAEAKIFEEGNHNLIMLAVRSLANLSNTSGGRDFLVAHADRVRELVSIQMQPTVGPVHRNVHIAATTCYINFAVMLSGGLITSTSSGEFARGLLQDLTILLGNNKVVDSETVYRALVAVGTLVQVPGAKDEKAEEVEKAVKSAAGRCKEPRVKGVVDEMMT